MHIGLLLLILAVLIFASVTTATPAPAGPPEPRVVLPLSGEWEFLPQHDNEEIRNGDSYQWGAILIPALWANARNVDPDLKLHELPCCWYRRRFQVDENLKGMDCLFRIVDVRWQAEVWLNGVKIGQHVGAYRPVEFDATAAVRPGQQNTLIIKVGGGHTIPKYEDGVPKIPFGNRKWAEGASGIVGDVDLRFFRRVSVWRVKIDPNILSGSCQATIWLKNHSGERQDVIVRTQAREKKSGKAASDAHDAVIVIEPGDTASISNSVKLRKPRLWSPESPFLYCLDIHVKNEEATCDRIRETFGMREFVVRDGGFYLNGKRIMLRGATDLAITAFPSWHAPASTITDPKWIKKYLVDDARGMNANVFRTHMGPWYKKYYEVADEHGIMLISEFPNWPPQGGANYYHRPGFVETLHAEMELIAANLWNHPSVVIWAGCNEPYEHDYTEDEKKYLEAFFKKLDPTRPMMRAGAVSEAIADQHNYLGFWVGTIGDHVRHALHLKQNNPGKPLCDTEYLESSVKAFSNPEWGRAKKWMGYKVTPERAEFTHALFAMEQTEVKRRLRFDGILPFWYAMFMGKGKVPGEGKWQTYYALKNSMAPIAVSLDLFDRHFAAGSELKLSLWAMNDLDKKARGKIDVYVLRDDPPYIYAGEPKTPISQRALEEDIPPYSATRHEVKLALAEEEGSYWLYATLRVKGRETVISKRPIHMLDRSRSSAHAKGVRVAILEQGSAITDWAKSVGMDARPVDGSDYQTLVIGKDWLGADAVRSKMDAIQEWVKSGGRLVILDQTTWPEGLFGLDVKKAASDISYLFKEKGQENDAVWRGVEDAHMENWNGSGAEGLTHKFSKSGDGTTLAIGWANQDDRGSKALLRLKLGEGEVLACQMLIAERLTEGTPMFDPVAERVMVNLLVGE